MMKVKAKTSSMKRPNAIWHMVCWGFGSGTILALLFIVFVIGLLSTRNVALLLIDLQNWVTALLFGGVSGAILGLLSGISLWDMSRNLPMPFTRADNQWLSFRVLAVLGLITSIAAYMLLFLFLSNFSFDIAYLDISSSYTAARFVNLFGSASVYYFALLLVLPPLIAGIASAYIGHRYLFRLHLWSEGNYGTQKEKDKHFERLEDKPKHEDSYHEGKTENRQRKTS